MRSQDAHGGNPVTLTSEPIPAELLTPVAADVDLALGGVPDFTAPKYSSESGGHRPPSEGAMTVPRPTVEDPELQTERDVRRRSAPASRSPDPTRRSGSHNAPPTGVPMVPLKPPSQVTMMGAAPPPPSTPPQNVPMARPRVDPSWSHPSVSGPAYEPEPVVRRGVPRFVYLVGPALAIAIVIIIVMATSGGSS